MRQHGIMAAVLLLAGAAGAGADDAAGAPLMRVQPLATRISKRGVPVPTVVTVSNPAMALSGTLEASVGGKDALHTWRHRLNIGKGRFRFFLYPQAMLDHPSSPLVVTLRDERGRIREQRSYEIKMQRENVSLLALTSRGRRLRVAELGGRSVHVAEAYDTGELPDRWFGYRAFDAVFVDLDRQEPLPKDCEKTLLEWVRAGGRLVLCARKDDAQLTSPVPSVLPRLTREPLTTEPVAPPHVLSVREFGADPDAPFEAKRLGVGWIVLLRIGFDALASLPPEDGARLIGQYIKTRKDPEEDWRYWQIYRLWQDPETYLRAPLARRSGYAMVSFAPILGLMLLYIAIVSLVDYLVLRRLRRLPFTWMTYPLIIVLFTGISYVLHYKGRIGPVTRHDLTFVDVGPGASGVRRSVACVRNNSNRPITFRVPQSHYIRTLDEEANPYGMGWRSAGRDAAVVEELGSDGKRSVSIRAYVGSYRFFVEEHPEQMEQEPFVYEQPSRRLPAGKLTSRTGREAIRMLLARPDRVHTVEGNLAVSRTSESIRKDDAYHFVDSYAYEYNYEQGSTDATRLTEVVTAMTRGQLSILHYGVHVQSRRPHVPSRLGGGLYEGLRPDDAVVLAFYSESGNVNGFVGSRVTCIRHLLEDTAAGEQTTENGER